jgi:hypothetical protein
MELYSAAIDEIYMLRAALAMEARLMESAMGYRTVPKILCDKFKNAVIRARAAATGRVYETYSAYPVAARHQALRLAGARTSLTRHEFEQTIRISSR